eukprot:1161712-Pelagomonas_calceolata.AAC.18
MMLPSFIPERPARGTIGTFEGPIFHIVHSGKEDKLIQETPTKKKGKGRSLLVSARLTKSIHGIRNEVIQVIRILPQIYRFTWGERFRFRFTWGDLQPDCLADRPVTGPRQPT